MRLVVETTDREMTDRKVQQQKNHRKREELNPLKSETQRKRNGKINGSINRIDVKHIEKGPWAQAVQATKSA